MKRLFNVTQVSEITGIDTYTIVTLIKKEWISPPQGQSELLDEEDIARIHLIQELRETFGANEEAVPIILHLVDQLYYLKEQVQKLVERK